ncbi:MAG: sugar ABC transporter substrate-binding protein [Chloroflexota bacterium]
MQRKIGLLALCSLLVLMAFAASKAQPSQAAQATLPATMAATAAMGKTRKVSFVPPAFTSPFHVAMADGAQSEADKLGWAISIQAVASEGDIAGQVTLVKKELDKGIDAISVNPITIEPMIEGVKAANAKNIPIFLHNFITPISDGKVAAYIGYDQWGGAEKLGIYTCGLLAKQYKTTVEKATGKVFILLGADSIFSHRRTQGYKAGLAETCPDVMVVGEQAADWLREKGASVATAALQKTPDIDVFYGNSDEMAIGAAIAAERLGLKVNKDFFAIAIDGNQPTLDLLKEGKFTATLGVDPVRMGVTVIDAMQTVLNGGTVPQIILTPSTVVDASNLQDYIDGKPWTTPTAGAPELDNGKPTLDKSADAAATMAATP